jgi:RimJ/RimL family protein N-acetyltransferase
MDATGPAYRIETDRLVIRCWKPNDAPLLHAAISESLEHLEPWMIWANEEPKGLHHRVELLRAFRGQFDLGQDFQYGIFDPTERRVLGATGLHTRRGEGVREIGYWIHAQEIHQGLATESTSALIRLAIELDRVRRVEIRCDPDNDASAAIPDRLGFAMEGILQAESDFMGTPRDSQVWSLTDDDYAQSPAKDLPMRAFDALGEIIPLEA